MSLCPFRKITLLQLLFSGLLVAVGVLGPPPLQLLFQSLLLLLQVRRHVVEVHLVQVFEAAVSP